MAGGEELALATCEGRVVDEKLHVNGGRIDGDKWERGAIGFVGDGGTDLGSGEACEANDVASGGAFDFNPFHAPMRKETGDATGF